MERDFLGVVGKKAGNGRGGVEVVVLDVDESPTKPDNPTAAAAPAPAQWQFPAKSGSAAPGLMSFRTAARGEGSEEFSISGFRPAGDAFDGCVKKQHTSVPVVSQQQRQFGLSSSQSQVTAQQAQQYPPAATAHGQRPQGMMDYSAAAAALHHLPGGSRLVQPLSVRHPAPPAPQFNTVNLMVRSQSFHSGTGVPSRNQQPFTMSNGFGGSTVGVYGARNPRNQTSTQLTIFYNGLVNVFDNIPVEKAKELMILASKASTPSPPSATHKPDSPVSAPAKLIVPEAPVSAPAKLSVPEVPISAPAKLNVPEVPARQIVIQKPVSCVPHLPSTSSPIPIATQVVALSRSASNCTTEACSSKPAVQPPVSGTISQATSSQPLATTSAPSVTLTPRAIPQARKASLARFLEKRKERVTSVEPYPTLKSPLQSSDTAGSASAPTKSSSTDIAPACINGTEPVRLGQPRNISFSSKMCPSTKLLI